MEEPGCIVLCGACLLSQFQCTVCFPLGDPGRLGGGWWWQVFYLSSVNSKRMRVALLSCGPAALWKVGLLLERCGDVGISWPAGLRALCPWLGSLSCPTSSHVQTLLPKCVPVSGCSDCCCRAAYRTSWLNGAGNVPVTYVSGNFLFSY